MLRELRNQGLCLILSPSLENIINIFSYFFFFFKQRSLQRQRKSPRPDGLMAGCCLLHRDRMGTLAHTR